MVEVLLLILAVAFFARRGRGKGEAADRWPDVLVGAERAGIITTTQHEALLAYAAGHVRAGTAARFGGAAWLGVFAGLFVVAGVSLLIARNWEDVGPIVRVGGFLVLLAAAGEGAIRLQARPAAACLPLELGWFFLPLLGIGLYGQTFHLSGDPIQPFLVWLALAAPLAWLSARPVVATLHTFALIAVLFVGNYVIEPMTAFGGVGTGRLPGVLALSDDGSRLLAWALSLVILAAIAAQSLHLLPRNHRHHFVGVWLVWTFCLLLAPTPFRLQHEGWLVVAAVAFATLWVLTLTALVTSFEERAASVGVWLTLAYALTFGWHLRDATGGATTGPGITVVTLVALAVLAGTVVLPNARLSPQRLWAFGAKVMLIVPLLVATLYLADDVRLIWLAAMAMNVFLLVVAVGLMWHGSLVHEAAQVNLGVLVLVGLLITRFLDVFGSMLRSGIGFIVAGLLLAGLSWALERARRRLLAGPPQVTS